ncbi:hypothetical protein, partial [Nodosilinea sp. LEGE 06152]|uniref:hypothetical protein n=1 Tax=Nodosilinea sp. LEGE 06152 TaxID=2777966 RepID=UPI001D158760
TESQAPGDFSSFILKGAATQATRGLLNLGWDGLPHFLRYKGGQCPPVERTGDRPNTTFWNLLFSRKLGLTTAA